MYAHLSNLCMCNCYVNHTLPSAHLAVIVNLLTFVTFLYYICNLLLAFKLSIYLLFPVFVCL